jgi:hypothetical protein
MAISKRQTIQYNKYQRIKTIIHDVYRQAKVFQSSLDELMEAQKKYLNHPEKDDLNQYYTGCLSGIADTLFDNLQTNQLEWLMYYTNRAGRVVYIKDWDKLPRYIKDSGKFNGNHFWKNPKINKDGEKLHRPFGNTPSVGVGMKR